MLKVEPSIDIISQFVARYRKEYDFYEQACRITEQILDSNLQSAGVRVIVTSRAKNPARLEVKVRQRDKKKKFKSVEEIFEDIVDLAGVRVALYFPAEREKVGLVISSLFKLASEPKVFPTPGQPTYAKRFSGYWATHYRVHLQDSQLNESQKRYTEANIEIQVASVLMHAWSEVEHDLVYKPLQGKLSEEEYAILDELNGLVLAGEIALERLQRAGEHRVSQHGREYTNHYDLASSLIDLARNKLSTEQIHESALGKVDTLYNLLTELELGTPENLERYIDSLHDDFEKRPLAEQIIDQILKEDSSRYEKYESIRDKLNTNIEIQDPVQRNDNSSILEFIKLWNDFEKSFRKNLNKHTISTNRSHQTIDPTSPLFDITISASNLRKFRNDLVHGVFSASDDIINLKIKELKSLINRLDRISNTSDTP